MRIVKWIALFIASLIISSCASYDFKSNYQHGVNVDDIAKVAKKAVEKQFDVDLSRVTWELADEYRLNRLAYQSAYNELKVMVNHPFFARLLSTAASSNVSSNILGRYKDNVKKIYINPEELDNAYSYDLKDLDVARQIYLALFIHEFVHAADFEKFTDEIKSEVYLPGQSELLGTLLEGNAEYLSEKLCQEYNCEEGYEILDKGSKFESKKDDSEESPKNKALSKIYKQELRFKYSIGKKYITEKYKKMQGKDPMPRKISELKDSQMLILYPDNEKLINNQFETARQMMDGLKVLESDFSPEHFIYHYEVFSPPRLQAIIKSYSGIKLPMSKKIPPYFQAMTLKLYNMSDDGYKEFDGYKYFMILLDMGEEKKSQQFLQKVTDGWKADPEIKTIRESSKDDIKNLSYASTKRTMVVQHNNFVLMIISKQEDLVNSLNLKYSEKIFGSL
jgi:hypothetical protein